MEIYVELVDICLPDYMARKANIAVPAWPGYTYADLLDAVYKEWYDGTAGPDCDPDDAHYAMERCIKRMKERAGTNERAWSDKVWDFQPFADDSDVYAYFHITPEM